VHVVLASAAPTPTRSKSPTITLVNVRSAPVPTSVFTNIESRLRKAGFQVVGSSDGDYLVICGRIPRRTMWGRRIPVFGAPAASCVQATSLAALGLRLDRPGGGKWQAIVEVAFEQDDYDHQRLLHLREIHTIYSGDYRVAGRHYPPPLSRLNDALNAWAEAYSPGFATR